MISRDKMKYIGVILLSLIIVGGLYLSMQLKKTATVVAEKGYVNEIIGVKHTVSIPIIL